MTRQPALVFHCHVPPLSLGESHQYTVGGRKWWLTGEPAISLASFLPRSRAVSPPSPGRGQIRERYPDESAGTLRIKVSAPILAVCGLSGFPIIRVTCWPKCAGSERSSAEKAECGTGRKGPRTRRVSTRPAIVVPRRETRCRGCAGSSPRGGGSSPGRRGP